VAQSSVTCPPVAPSPHPILTATMIATRLFAAALLLATGVLASPIVGPADELAGPTKTSAATEDEALGGTPASKRALPTSTVTCGSNKYTVAKVVSAVSTGGNYLAAGSAPGGYPHRFYNYEGLNMWCSSVPSGPWYEVGSVVRSKRNSVADERYSSLSSRAGATTRVARPAPTVLSSPATRHTARTSLSMSLLSTTN